METATQTYRLFVMYLNGSVVGMMWHLDGDRACDKAEELLGEAGVTYNHWSKASSADRRLAKRLPELT